jgi:phosphoglycerol transferase MdoB-like AlkP superfamily enzyme
MLPMNVFVIAVESLSAEFLEHFGNNEKITPNLDKLAEESLFFTNIYATGTRSVRGLEALTLSLPPTPGYSVVKRPDNAHLFSLGSMFKKFNYDLKFIYGGYGYFDNMNAFFRNNNFEIVDRASFSKKEISFANIWGIADEDVLLRMVKEADKAYLENKHFCYFTLTISNHRPYTYTEGRIDIPSGTSRGGAVKYTDYAIGKFIEVAKTRPWFSDTLFVIVADHSAKGRGKISIPVASYHIPLLMYAPKVISPQMIDKVASQMDVIPTIADIMKINYQSKFLGRSILTMTKDDERFFSGTYQSLGYYRHGSFVELGPKKSIKVYRYDPIKRELNTELIKDDVVAKEAIAYYQYAGFLLDHDLYGEEQ